MARGTQLQVLRKMVRAEAGRSTNVAQGANQVDQLNQLLQRTQENLHDSTEWEFLKFYVDATLATGSLQEGRYNSFGSGVTFERITRVQVRPSPGDSWREVVYGIDADQYNSVSSDDGNRRDPVQRWQFHQDGTGDQYEVWPMPASGNQTLRMHAKKNLGALIADSDTASLDDQLIVLFAAAELLTPVDKDLAGAKMSAAQSRLMQLNGQQRKTPMIIMGGGVGSARFHGPTPRYGARI